jgi:hypothetical protein
MHNYILYNNNYTVHRYCGLYILWIVKLLKPTYLILSIIIAVAVTWASYLIQTTSSVDCDGYTNKSCSGVTIQGSSINHGWPRPYSQKVTSSTAGTVAQFITAPSTHTEFRKSALAEDFLFWFIVCYGLSFVSLQNVPKKNR